MGNPFPFREFEGGEFAAHTPPPENREICLDGAARSPGSRSIPFFSARSGPGALPRSILVGFKIGLVFGMDLGPIMYRFGGRFEAILGVLLCKEGVGVTFAPRLLGRVLTFRLRTRRTT